MPLNTDDARNLARLFLDAAHAVNTFRFDNWDSITPNQQQMLADAGWDLLNDSTSLTTVAVGLALNDMSKDLKTIIDATTQAKDAVKAIQDVKKAINIATALVTLGAAIISTDPGGIMKAAQGVYTAVTS